MNDSLRVCPLGPHKDAYLSLTAEALLCPDPELWETYLERIGVENVRVVLDGEDVLGGLTFYPVQQWFGGKPVPVAGVSGVAIDPARRGGGVCNFLLRESMRQWREAGIPLGCLYASTQRLYRKVGFEQSGTRTQYSMPIEMFATGSSPASDRLPVTRYETPPLDRLAPIAEIIARENNGHFERNEGLWKRLIHPTDGSVTRTYIVGQENEPTGYAIFKIPTRAGGYPGVLSAMDIGATNRPALARLIDLIRDHRSMCGTFQWFGAANDPLLLASAEVRAKIDDQLRWLTRIIDVPGALSARGYNPSVTATLDLMVTDDCIAENEGHWRLSVRDGAGNVERLETEPHPQTIRIDIRDLAVLYTSYFTATSLSRYGRLVCSDNNTFSIADQIFAGPAPWMSEIF